MTSLLVVESDFNKSHYPHLIGEVYPGTKPPGYAQVIPVKGIIEFCAERMEVWYSNGGRNRPPLLLFYQEYEDYLKTQTKTSPEKLKNKG